MPRAKQRIQNFDPKIREILLRGTTEEVVFTRGTPPAGLDTDELLEWNDRQRRKLNVLTHRLNSFKKIAKDEQIDGWEEFQKVDVHTEPNAMRAQRVVVSPKDSNIRDLLDQIPDITPKLPEDFTLNIPGLTNEDDFK